MNTLIQFKIIYNIKLKLYNLFKKLIISQEVETKMNKANNFRKCNFIHQITFFLLRIKEQVREMSIGN